MSREPARPEIHVLLPYAEGFGPEQAGAIALGVRDAARRSRFRQATTVFGRPLEPVFDGVRFVPLEPAWPRLLGRNRGLAEAYRRRLDGRRDPLVELYNRPLMVAWLARTAPGLQLTIQLANDPLTTRDLRRRASRGRLLRRVRAVYCVSAFVRRRFLEGLEEGHEKVHVVHNGVVRPPARPGPKIRSILYVGRVVPGKGVDHLIEALKTVLPRHPDWQAEVIGASRPGAEAPSGFEQDLRRQAAPLGERVRWLSFMPYEQVTAHYARAAIVVVPSVMAEAFGRTAAEGLAHGCAVVGYGSGGLPEVLEGRGLVLDETTPARLASALERLIGDDRLRAGLQERAWSDFPFTVEAMAEGYDRLRERLFEARPR